MGKKLVSRTAKVLSETRKSRDKEAVAIAYEHIPRNPEEQKHGSLYAVIELEDAGGHAEQIAEKIIDVLHDEYYEDLDKDPLTSFESALAKINEELAERSSEGQINWIGKLNAVLGVLTESTLHVTQAGRAEAYLYRGEHSMHVTEDLSGDAINPLRTFMNVASGDLTEKDRLLFVTPGVFYKLSKTEIKKYVTELAPKVAVENLSQILSGETGSTLPNAVLILEMVSPESFAAEEEPGAEAWVKEEKKPLEPIAEETLTGAVKAFDMVGKAFSTASTFVTTKAAPEAKRLVGKIKDFRKEQDAERIIIESEEKMGLHPEDLDLEDHNGILESTESEREIRIQETKKPKILSLERVDFSRFKNAGKSLSKYKVSLPKGKFSFVYVLIGIVLIIGILGFSIYKDQVRNQRVASENTFKQAQSKYQEALGFLSSGRRSEAVEDLATAENLAKEAQSKKYPNTEVEKLLADIASAKEQSLGITKNTAQEFADFAQTGLSALYSDGTAFYGVDFTDGSIYSVDLNSKTTAVVAEKPLTEGVKFATFAKSRKSFIFYTLSNKVYEVDIATKKAKEQTISGTAWEDATAIASYLSNIYLLSPTDNQIYKHQKSTSGYGKKISYLSGAAVGELTGAVSLAIDSDVYTISEDGQVNKYTSGAKKPYMITGLPRTLSGVKSVYADPNVKGLYVLTADSVVKIDENGNFVAEYKSDTVKSVEGITVDDEQKIIYLLSTGKLYTISF